MPIVDPAAYDPADIFHIDLAQIRWKSSGAYGQDADPRSRLNAIIRIGGADHHLEAIEVAEIDGMQVGVNGAEEVFEELDAFNGTEGKFETVQIEGRHYALAMTPFKV